MRVAVTGASGFLGAAVLRQLVEAGFDCIGVSRRDISGLYHVKKYSETPAADCLIHCAETNERAIVNASGALMEIEARQTLDAFLNGKFEHVIYMSSSVVYGDQWITPRKVSDPVDASDTYARIKLASEQAVLKSGGAVARLSNLYGPGMAAGNVLSHIFGQLDTGRAITMHFLEPIRDFLWIDDAAQAVRAIVEKKSAGIFNIGSGRGTSIRQLVQLAQTISGSNQDVIGLRTGESPSYLVLDIADTEKSIDWIPQIYLKDGILRLLNMKLKIK